MTTLMKRSKNKGQIAVETAVAWSIIIAGLLGMFFYMQRGLQGNYWGSIQSTGAQFDPRDEYSDLRKIVYRIEKTDQVPRAQVVGADLMPLPASEDSNPFGLTTVPTGPVFREAAFSYSAQNTIWKTETEYRFDDIH